VSFGTFALSWLNSFCSVKRIEQDFKLKHHGSIPTSNQIAELLGLPAKKIALLRTQVKEVTSLDEPLYPHSNSKGNVLTKKDRLQDTTLNPSEKADVAVAAEQLCGILEQLNLREAEVVSPQISCSVLGLINFHLQLRLRFGLQSIHALTLDEIGQKYSVTRERVRQIEARALSKMRVPTRAEQVEIMFRARRGHTRTFKRT
jgi:RNA polymerase primary sigma factor